MSAIAGIFHRDGAPVHSSSLEKILAAMPYRSSDEGRAWSEASLGFAFHSLDTTAGPTRQELPFVDRKTGLAIVGDLRIDNRHILWRELGVDRSGETIVGDPELVLAAYDRWGREAPARFRGAFAFAIWDPRRHEIVCARDHLGCKPFAYHLSRELFVFASEAEAVAAAPDVPRRLNEARIADFLIDELEGVDHVSTFFDGVLRLRPGNLLVVDREGHRIESYWRPDSNRSLRLASDTEYVERFREALGASVAGCLTGAESAAISLSGGIDSGVVAATADEISSKADGPRLFTVSAVSGDGCLESGCIRDTTRLLGIDAHFLDLAELEVGTRRVEDMFLGFSEPFDAHLVMPALLYHLASSRGAGIVLDGIDGDVVMSAGAMHVAHLVRRGQFLRASREARALRAVQSDGAFWGKSILSGLWSAWVPSGAQRAWGLRCGERRRTDSAIGAGIINRDFARRVDLDVRLQKLDRQNWFTPSGDVRRDQADSLVHPYVAAALERYDRVASRFGVDLRHPLLDLRLVELCLSMPWHLKTRGGWTKYIARLAYSDVLPESVRWRRGTENVMWLFTARTLNLHASLVTSIIMEHRKEIEAYVDFPKVAAAVGEWESGCNPAATETVLQAFTLASWLRRMILEGIS